MPKESVSPFMQELINNNLSKELREEMELEGFHKDIYGYSVFGEIFVTNKYGANVAQTKKTTYYYQRDEEWWQAAERDGLYIGDVHYDESAGLYAIDIGIRIDDENGDFLGVMKVILNIEDVISVLKELNLMVYVDPEWQKIYGDYIVEGEWFVAEVNVDIRGRKKAENDLKKAYEELKKLQNQLIQAEKMAALGTLSAGIAHEINNPLMGVMLLAQNLASEKEKDSLEYKTLSQIEGGLKRISEVISKLLAFSRKEKLIFKEEKINDIIDSTLPLILHEFELNKIELVKDYAENLPLLDVARTVITFKPL